MLATRLRLAFVGAWLLALAAVASPAAADSAEPRVHPVVRATDVTVTNSGDSGSGSLRAALAGIGRDERVDVHFAADVRGQITLTRPLTVESGVVAIDGPGAPQLAISGNDLTRIFVVGPEAGLRVSGLTLTHGRDVGLGSPGGDPGGPGEGGAILNRGTVALTGVVLSANEARGGDSFRSHGGPGFGGAISNRGVMTITRSVLSGNVARGSQDHDKRFDSRDLTGGAAAGGAVYNEGRLGVAESEFTGNRAIGGDGIAIFALFTVVGTAGGDAFGGAIFDGRQSPGLWIADSTFTGDSALGGSSGTSSRPQDPAGAAAGGAVFSWAAGFSMVRSTVVRESAVLGEAQATPPADLGAGGLELRGGGFLLRSSTIAFDTGSADVRTVMPVPTLDTIVGSCAGAGLRSQGYNLAYRSGCGFDAATDLRDTDARLGGLADNGGPTRTMSLGPDSPAVDAGFGPEATDQRGQLRPVQFSNKVLPPGGNAADIGAYELQRLPELRYELAPQEIGFGPVPVGTVSKFQEVSLANVGDVLIRLGTVTIGGRDADEFSLSSETCSGVDLGPGANCRVRVRFSPEEVGARLGTLTIASATVGPIVVPLRGVGAAADAGD